MQIANYGSFRDSNEIRFEDGLNVLIGQNNAGKSLVLSALKFEMPDLPHRNSERYQDFEMTRSRCRVDVSMRGTELRQAILELGGIDIPAPSESDAESYLGKLIAAERIGISISKTVGSEFQPARLPSLIDFEGTAEYSVRVQIIEENGIRRLKTRRITPAHDGLPSIVKHIWQRNVFYFAPQRFHLARIGYGRYERLEPDANNLAGVLSLLMSERRNVYDGIVEDMREIFPSVRNITVINKDTREFEVRIWPSEDITIPQLSQPLDLNGTGISQALAIVTAAAMGQELILLIDEVNTFLHPGATKSLIRTLQTRYPSHQYILSTHSSEVLGLHLASSIHYIRKTGFESTIKPIDAKKVEELAYVASNVGTSPADILGSDRIVWVEGPTEELCFTELLRGIDNDGSVRFLPVIATGDFDFRNKDRERTIEIYRAMTSAVSPLQGKPVFAFDREGLSNERLEDLRKRSQYRMMFLPRRNLECYFLAPLGIAKFYSEIHPEIAELGSINLIKAKMEQLVAEYRFAIPQWNGDIEQDDWLRSVDGAKLLSAVVSELSGQKVEYRKTSHSLGLIGALQSDAPEALEELIVFLREVVKKARGIEGD